MDNDTRCDERDTSAYVDELGSKEGEWLCPSGLWARRSRPTAEPPPRSIHPHPSH